MKHSLHTCALLAAAGLGRRLAADSPAGESPAPKAFINLAGKPLFYHSLKVLRACDKINSIVIITPPSEMETTLRWLQKNPAKKPESVVAGGVTRQESIYNGLSSLPEKTDFVLIHDAARPFLTDKLVVDCLNAAVTHGAATCGLPTTDTIKSSADGRLVTETLDRSTLWNIQTPQAFAFKTIWEAHETAKQRHLQASDDAALVEALGRPVSLVAGASENIKITHKTDLTLAEQELSGKSPGGKSSMRIGMGFDVHAFSDDRKLILAGLELPGPGLAGHSDADLICHAVMDALLGAAGLGDIGLHFPDTDPQFAAASSIALLQQVQAMLSKENLKILWLDIVVAAQAPKIAPHAAQMRTNLARALQIDSACISLKGKTTEGLGFVGREEGLACWAVCLLSAG